MVDRWPGNVVCLLFFQAGLFPKNRAEPFFIHISMVVTRSSKAATPRCRNRFRMAHHARPFLRLFSRYGCSPRSGLHLCTDASYIYVLFFAAMLHFIKTFRYVIKARPRRMHFVLASPRLARLTPSVLIISPYDV